MTDPIQPRPQPVAEAAAVAGNVLSVVTGLAGILATLGAVTHWPWTLGAAAALTAVAAGLAKFMPSITAVGAAAQVTPLSDPVNAKGEPLVDPSSYGKHAAPANPAPQSVHLDDRSASMGPDLPDPQPRTDYYAKLRANADTREQAAVTDGIHAHPTKKLGKLAPIPGRKAVPFGQFLTAAPEHPIVDAAPQLTYPMYRNDQAGDCVVAGLGHTLQVISAQLGVPWTDWTDDQVLHFYQTQNPGFRSWADAGGSADQGMIIQTFLEYLVAQKLILAFGKVDHTNEDEMKAAVYLGLAVVTGEELQTAQQSQAVWDYKKSGDWGGHCTCTVGYQATPDRQTVVTWGALTDVTQAFITHQLDEAWFVLTQAHVDHPAFRDHFDVAGFAAAVSELTGGKVVVPVPTPTPTPVPVPPTPPSVGFPLAEYDRWKVHTRSIPKTDAFIAATDTWLANS